MIRVLIASLALFFVCFPLGAASPAGLSLRVVHNGWNVLVDDDRAGGGPGQKKAAMKLGVWIYVFNSSNAEIVMPTREFYDSFQENGEEVRLAMRLREISNPLAAQVILPDSHYGAVKLLPGQCTLLQWTGIVPRNVKRVFVSVEVNSMFRDKFWTGTVSGESSQVEVWSRRN